MIGYLLLFLTVFAAIIGLQAPPLIRNRQWPEFAAFSFFMLFALVVTVPQIYGIQLPNPADLIFRISDPFVKWLLKDVLITQ
ncbi:MAG: hypothetical protein WC364_08190 [Eubacteriales bacterium]|jgi:hypothetical protein